MARYIRYNFEKLKINKDVLKMEREGLELIPIQVEYICGAIKPLDYKYPTVRYKRKEN
jgi:hypothetical protein